jgi:hypothetical protein
MPPVSVKFSGVQSTINKMKKRHQVTTSGGNITVEVGYAAPYAIYVHEDLQAHHTVGEAKFLSKAVYRTDKLRKLVFQNALNQGKSMEKALLESAKLIIAQSQLLVPVDTGFLKNSVFTTVTKT